MLVNADFSQRVIVHASELPWAASPTPGVERRMLDRVGGEVARATSIVRYAPGSRFPPHVHGGGEEFLVLDGVFSDESGDMPAGTYVRNPPCTAHAPSSAGGCTIFVKLRQFDADDHAPVRVDIDALPFVDRPDRPGLAEAILHEHAGEHARETVRIENWAADARIGLALPGGGEFLLLTGDLLLTGGSTGREDVLRPMSWLRLPRGETLSARRPARCPAMGQGRAPRLSDRTGRTLANPATPPRPDGTCERCRCGGSRRPGGTAGGQEGRRADGCWKTGAGRPGRREDFHAPEAPARQACRQT